MWSIIVVRGSMEDSASMVVVIARVFVTTNNFLSEIFLNFDMSNFRVLSNFRGGRQTVKISILRITDRFFFERNHPS